VTQPIPVLEIGGTHATAAVVDPSQWRVDERGRTRARPDSHADADRLLASISSSANATPPASRHWGVAIPDAALLGAASHVTDTFASLKISVQTGQRTRVPGVDAHR
jgi:hypothetical protein